MRVSTAYLLIGFSSLSPEKGDGHRGRPQGFTC
jgi:hypothetical protein